MFKKMETLNRQVHENKARMKEIMTLCEKENRERTAEEDQEYRELVHDNYIIGMKKDAMENDELRENSGAAEAEKILRENVKNGQQTEIKITREFVKVANATTGGIVPVKMGDIVEPLEEGLILNKVGLPLPTGLAGDYFWPTYENVTATIAEEAAALSDTEITLNKITATPQRIGIAIPVTRQTINQTEGVIETIIKKIMPMSVAKLMNKIMFSVDAVPGAVTLKGPFVGKKATAKVLTTDDPTFAEYNELKTKVLESGVDGEHLCFVMTKAQKAKAEAKPKDAGSGIMVCENDHICGIPVFTTQYIGEGNIGCGDWRYQPCGLFGDIDFIVDPYSKARNNAVDFVLNVNYGTATLNEDAFALMRTKSAKAADAAKA